MKTPLLFLLAVTSAILLCHAPRAAAVTCDPKELTPCAGPIMGSAAPSPACCAKLRQQRPCLCKYKKDPKLQNYVNSKNSKKVAAACKVPIPRC